MARVKLYSIPLHDSYCYLTPYTETKKQPGVMHCLIVFLQLRLRKKFCIYLFQFACVCLCVGGGLFEKKTKNLMHLDI